jgi:hypothetical protein
VQTAFQKILDDAGITDEKLGQTISEGLDAYKVISANIIRNGKSKIADEQDGMKDADENTKDFVEVPDFMAGRFRLQRYSFHRTSRIGIHG